MANLLQSSESKSTCAPGYYTSALCTLATQGKQDVCGAKYIGATPLQQQAFQTAAARSGAAQPALTESGQVLGCVAGKNISGAANPYLCAAFTSNPAALAACYMSPYIQNAVQGMSNIAQRNIQQNLSPMATAATIGSGQFGSQRGAQVLGQVEENALNDLNTQIANLENTGYMTAQQAATARQNLLNQMGSTAATAAAQCASAKNIAGANLANLANVTSGINIACAENLAKLGAECQTILQNAQCYGLAKLCKYAGILGKNQVPTTVKTTFCMSPYSAAATIGTGALGIANCAKNIVSAIKCGYNVIKCIFGGNSGGIGGSYASGGLVNPVGCASQRRLGGLPKGE